MKILVLGATGYIGSATVNRLLAEGHEVVAFTRSGEAANLPSVAGDLTDPASLRAAITGDIDAVINIAPPTGDEDADHAATDAIVESLAGSGRAYVYTSGIWVLGETGDDALDEDAPTNAIAIVGYRPRVEQRVLDAASRDVRTAVIRPGIVHGNGGGIPGMMIGWAKEQGVARHVGENTRWPMVHVDDLAALFTLAVTGAKAGSLYHGVGEESVLVADLAAATGAPTEVWTQEEAAAVVGEAFAEALGLNQVVSGAKARAELGWSPLGPGAVESMRS
ncbi:hypothetical protein Afil01_22760 [Actinorhabdospora filicis]|uniref:NAD-dependent epimerase/dehydratase domain-containing protein n=1 Tax=Actinorhabdospora filicis TaxID=1785913 RepID=A0A9W6SKQ8_9ACTN|nr:NAD-dependent epimerase/dehydratase family protein [Actinorhabdospora filicis]GLZ77469.1 hypothetical protein Afil01_22760 [Actinorhabdospora filicis]